MQLISIDFFVFFAISLVLYYLFPARYRYLLLLLFSYAFFLLSTPLAFPYILASSVAVWIAARRKTKASVIICIVFNVLLLAVSKYMDFFVGNLNGIIHIWNADASIQAPDTIVPIGISYYTLSVTGYLLDVYWGKTNAQPDLAKTMLFAGYYPQLTSGPVSRYGEVCTGLFAGVKPSYENITFGLQRILWGAFKKLVIATRAKTLVDSIYADIPSHPGFYIPVAAFFFIVELYADFSGCMDIILGVSECYGIKIPENFRTPFLSQTVREFWQRWHITLGEWFRDYIMYPVLKSPVMSNWSLKLRKKTKNNIIKSIPVFMAMLIVWLLLGLWHGGAWKYVLGMGLWFWCIIVLSEAVKPVTSKIKKKLGIKADSIPWRAFNSIRVFIAVAIGNLFFRLPSVSEVFTAVRTAFSRWNPEIFFDGSLFGLGVNKANFIVLSAAVIIMAVVSVAGSKVSVRARLKSKNIVLRWTILLALIWCVVVFGIYGPGYDASDFIYGNF